MTARALRVRPGVYVDSVRLMSVSRQLRDHEGVRWGDAVMATAANRQSLHDQGFDSDELQDVGADDLVIAVVADADDIAEQALAAAEEALAAGAAGTDGAPGAAGPQPPQTLAEAVARLADPTLAVISVPGPYAALEAHKALNAGLHVLLFSDNVPLDDEITLKRRAIDEGRLLMGPGAGTAALTGVGLGFANVARSGNVGVVAAAGTGAQEMMVLLDRYGAGVSHVIGLGGRDLSEEVGGLMAIAGIRALATDPATELIVLVSKPPAAAVAEQVLASLDGMPAVAALIGLDQPLPAPRDVVVVDGLEAGARAAIQQLGLPSPDPAAGLAETVASVTLPTGRTAIRGLYSGGTLCYEALVTLSRRLGPVHSNTPLRDDWGLPAADGAHVCLDLGEEEYTQGRPHPMIDPQARVEAIQEAAADPHVGVIILDVVLGHGAHADPAGELATALEAATRNDGPVVVAYVLGSDHDPQHATTQRQQLEAAGCLLAPTAQRAALMAAAIVAGRPEIAEE